MSAVASSSGGPSGILASKTVLITGVSRGLGRALALELAGRGHTIIGCARSEEKLNALRAEIPQPRKQEHLLTPIDVRSDGSVKDLAKLVVEAGKVPDIIVNNAGTINKNNKIWDVPAEEFDTVIDTNIKGIANVLRHFLPLLIQKRHGFVVNVSSGWGRSAAAEVAPYCATKWAVEGLTRAVAKELPPGVAIVALSPGVVNTDMLASCFGSSASFYQSPENWAPKAAAMNRQVSMGSKGCCNDPQFHYGGQRRIPHRLIVVQTGAVGF